MPLMNDDLREKVVREAHALRVHASSFELNRLNIDELTPNSEECCIYGLLTGNCYSLRAIDLLNLCAAPYSSSIVNYHFGRIGENFPLPHKNRDFSAIEFYIVRRGAERETLIQFLRGERETLTIDDL